MQWNTQWHCSWHGHSALAGRFLSAHAEKRFVNEKCGILGALKYGVPLGWWFLCLRDRKIILLAQIKIFLFTSMYEICEHEWNKSHFLITQWLIFAGLNFAGVFFLLELILEDQVPSTIPSNFKYRIIKVLQGMFVQSLFWNSSLLLSHSLITASAMVISKFGSRLGPTEDACLCSWSI